MIQCVFQWSHCGPHRSLFGCFSRRYYDVHLCGVGVLEVKCPFTCRDKSFLEQSKKSTFFLVANSGNMALDNSHMYYHQVQAEIKLCGAKFSKFIASRKVVLQSTNTEHI